MPLGTCKLCLQQKELQDSHFVGKGLYKIAQKRGGPVVMTPELFIATSDQLHDYLLCRECEQLFSREGEDYVTRLVKHSDNDFPLLQKLNAAKPLAKGQSGALVFAGATVGVDTDKLAYYALSMFWRASVHVWKTLNQQTTSIVLGEYEAPIWGVPARGERLPT